MNGGEIDALDLIVGDKIGSEDETVRVELLPELRGCTVEAFHADLNQVSPVD